MKILHTADWHIGQFKGPVVDGVNLRSQDTVKCLEYVLHTAFASWVRRLGGCCKYDIQSGVRRSTDAG